MKYPRGMVARGIVKAAREQPQTTTQLVRTIWGEWDERHYQAVIRTARQLEREGFVRWDRTQRPAVISVGE